MARLTLMPVVKARAETVAQIRFLWSAYRDINLKKYMPKQIRQIPGFECFHWYLCTCISDYYEKKQQKFLIKIKQKKHRGFHANLTRV